MNSHDQSRKQGAHAWQSFNPDVTSSMLKSLNSVHLPPPPVAQSYMGLPDRRPLQDSTNIQYGLLKTPQSLPRDPSAGHLDGVGKLAGPQSSWPPLPTFSMHQNAAAPHILSPGQSPMFAGQLGGDALSTPTRFEQTGHNRGSSIEGSDLMPLRLLPADAVDEHHGAVASRQDSEIDHMGMSDELSIEELLKDIPELVDDGGRPPYSYAMLIGMAILRSPQRKLTLAQIYSWINTTFAWYRTSSSGWQNSIRHNLSLSKAFVKQERPKSDPGKGNYWVVTEGYERQFLKPPGKRQRPQAAPVAVPQFSENSAQQANSENSSATPEPAPITTIKLPRLAPLVQAQPPQAHKAEEFVTDEEASSPARETTPVDSTEVTVGIASHLSTRSLSAGSDASPRYNREQRDEDHEFTLKRPRPLEVQEPRKRLLTDLPTLGTPPRMWLPPTTEAYTWEVTNPEGNTIASSSEGNQLLVVTPPRKQAPLTLSGDTPILRPPTLTVPSASRLVMGSPNTSLRNHRAFIKTLTAPSVEMQALMASPDTRLRDEDENSRIWLESSIMNGSPEKDARRRLFATEVRNDEHITDLFGRPLVDGGLPSLVTPIRRPFDTPIRDQRYAFSPYKQSPGGFSGSPRR